MKISATASNIETICDRLASGEINLAQAAKETGWALFTDEGTDENPVLVPEPNVIHADDGNGEVTYTNVTAEQAAQEYVDGGSWGNIEETEWVRVFTWMEGINESGEIVDFNRERHSIAIDPPEPPCTDGQDHDFQSPHEIVGGLESNPGVHGHGGGVTITEVCMHCGCERFTDTWAQNPETGEQGLESVRFTADKYAEEVSKNDEEEEEEDD